MIPIVLVVDNERDVLNVFSEMLKLIGFKVYAVDNTADAFNMMNDSKFDLIITDLIMPDMNGLDFIKRLRKHGNNTPVVITSGLNPKKVMINLDEYGISEYIVKPFTINDIKQKLSKFMQIQPAIAEVV